MMETPMAVDVVGLLDPDLLQLCPGVASPSCRPAAAEKLLDDLFNQWLSLPDTQRMVMTLLHDAQGEAVPGSQGSPTHTSHTSLSLLPTVFKEGATPPLSPRNNSPLSPRSQRRLSGHTSSGSPLKKTSEPLREVIPQVSHRLAIDTDMQPS